MLVRCVPARTQAGKALGEAKAGRLCEPRNAVQRGFWLEPEGNGLKSAPGVVAAR